MITYKAVLFAPDGEWVTDHRECETIAEVEECIADQGSRWYFYPFVGVIRDNGGLTRPTQRLVAVAEPFGDMQGRTIRTFARMLDATPDEDLQALLY